MDQSAVIVGFIGAGGIEHGPEVKRLIEEAEDNLELYRKRFNLR